ncbi:hypothetical protein OUZ56_004949 [Daphnia magna]|uniref:Uncharacterized protein n=1 Tax=Daphnia magna TaxID=35525 RepID=A0ABQ9YRC3_9CRUS|nr:hypothetical protein OUZ56_004949 [Daphnia magna]
MQTGLIGSDLSQRGPPQCTTGGGVNEIHKSRREVKKRKDSLDDGDRPADSERWGRLVDTLTQRVPEQ